MAGMATILEVFFIKLNLREVADRSVVGVDVVLGHSVVDLIGIIASSLFLLIGLLYVP